MRERCVVKLNQNMMLFRKEHEIATEDSKIAKCHKWESTSPEMRRVEQWLLPPF